jgi:hypothetical protein
MGPTAAATAAGDPPMPFADAAQYNRIICIKE